MSHAPMIDPDDAGQAQLPKARGEHKFKKLIRPLHATKRANLPARLRGMHRRRRKRMSW